MVFCKQFCTDFTKPNVRMFDTLTPLSHHQDTHLIILFAPVHRGSWNTPVSRVGGDWSHLLFSSSQRLIFLLRSSQTISLFLSHYVSVIKNTKRPKYKLIIPFYFIKKIYFLQKPTDFWISKFKHWTVWPVWCEWHKLVEQPAPGKLQLARYWPENHCSKWLSQQPDT